MKHSTFFLLTVVGLLFFSVLRPIRAEDSTSSEEDDDSFEYKFEMRPNKVEIEIEKEDNISEYKLEFKIKNEEGLYVKMEVENDSGEIETESETKLRMKEIIIFERASKDDVYEHGTSTVVSTYDLTSEKFTDFKEVSVTDTVTSFTTETTDGKLKAIFYVTKTNTEDGENYYTPTSIKFDLLFDFSLGANQGVAMLCKMDTDVEVEKGDSEEAKAGKAVLPEAQIGGSSGFFSFATKAKAAGAAASELEVFVSNIVKDSDSDSDDEKREYKNTQKFYVTFKSDSGTFTWDPKLGTSSSSLPGPAASLMVGVLFAIMLLLF